MIDSAVDNEKSTDEQNIYSFFVGGLMLTLPYLFCWHLMQGNDFALTYVWYLRVAGWAGGVAAVLVTIILAVKRRWPTLFEKPPEPPEWVGIAGAGLALLISLVGGILEGFKAGALLFWPSVFFTSCLFHGCYWLTHQAKRLWMH